MSNYLNRQIIAGWLMDFGIILVKRREFRGAFSLFLCTSCNFFQEIFGAAKRVYKVLLIATEPSVHKKFVKKVTKKVLT